METKPKSPVAICDQITDLIGEVVPDTDGPITEHERYRLVRSHIEAPDTKPQVEEEEAELPPSTHLKAETDAIFAKIEADLGAYSMVGVSRS
ncbi:MAG TPA: hypothetical protein VMR34_05600 [Candidatus Saccharimonadales bacterium]|nr:hypothetical protein [Candidatus Saccharimonadales bacterium]